MTFLDGSTVRIVVEDEVHVQLQGLPPDVARDLEERLSVFVPSAVHTPRYVMGLWDGRVRFFESRTSRTYLTLMPDVVPVLRAAGLRPIVEDRRKQWDFCFGRVDAEWFARRGVVWPAGHAMGGEPVVLRDHQVEAISRALAFERGVVRLPTGSGKTLVAAALCTQASAYGRVWTLVPGSDLVRQTSATYEVVGLEPAVADGPGFDWSTPRCVVTTWQKLWSDHRSRNLDVPEDLVALIVDEVHTVRANVLRTLLGRVLRGVPLRWGLTATLPAERHDVLSVVAHVGPVVGEIGIVPLQESGVLADVDLLSVRLNVTGWPRAWEGIRERCANDSVAMDAIATVCRVLSERGSVLCLVERLESVAAVLHLVPEAVGVTGSVSKRRRGEIWKLAETSPGTVVVATYGVASTGIDVPSLAGVVLWDAGRSPIRTLQSIGRGMRRTQDKRTVTIVDIWPGTRQHARHWRERSRLYESSGLRVHYRRCDPREVEATVRWWLQGMEESGCAS